MDFVNLYRRVWGHDGQADACTNYSCRPGDHNGLGGLRKNNISRRVWPGNGKQDKGGREQWDPEAERIEAAIYTEPGLLGRRTP